MPTTIIDEAQAIENMMTRENPYHEQYFAFYSSWLGGIVKNPRLMLIPIDDHMVHRGDGVFEAMKSVGRKIYLMDEHLERLFLSAEKIALVPPVDIIEMKNIILETLQAANQNDAVIRLYLSRGPGGFTVNPYDSLSPQLYIVITALKPPPHEKYQKGATVGKSELFSKPSWMAQIKSCNYLPNVLMKKEAVDRGLDYVVGTDKQGHITESATENILIVDGNGIIVHPPFQYILKGTTMLRACELARENNMPTDIRPITLQDIESAQEVMIAGTTQNIIPVVQFESLKISNGTPGPIATKLCVLMVEDIKKGSRSVSY
jgi:4-amino-4-deoxychorismate lyase